MPQLPAKDRFKKFIDDVSRFYIDARASQVKFAWETGRRIVEEEQNGGMRAAYGARLIPEMSEALTKKHGPGFSTRTLANMRQFYQTYPILPGPAKLGWADYLELLPVKDDKTRKHLEQRVLRENLNSVQLRREVHAVRRAQERKSARAQDTGVKATNLPPLKCPIDLKLNTFAVSTVTEVTDEGLAKDEVMIDCGFFVNRPVSKTALKKVTVAEKPSYTYEAVIERVVDGDTLVVLIRAGFRNVLREKLRLRGINTPELGTPEGEAAKKFVMKLLPAGTLIVLKSHKCKTDTYGRFVADVFFKEGAHHAKDILTGSVYLNQHLLDEGYAVRMAE